MLEILLGHIFGANFTIFFIRYCSHGAYQEVRLRIGPLAKLGRFKSTVDNFLIDIITISLASGPTRSLTSWYAKVLHAVAVLEGYGLSLRI